MKKSLIVFTYFASPSSDFNLQFFVSKELTYKEDIDYIIVINGYTTSIHFPTIPNLTIIRRENIGYDFGGHAHALQYIHQHNKNYDYYFFMNSGVFGPIWDNNNHWSNVFIQKITDKVKLVGTSIVCLNSNQHPIPGPRIEGFCFMVDSIGLTILENKKNIFCKHIDKRAAIVDGEYGLSTAIFQNGYTIDCMLPIYKNIDWTNPKNHNLNNNQHASRKNGLFGSSINPYDVIFHKWFWRYEEDVHFNIINDYKKKNENK